MSPGRSCFSVRELRFSSLNQSLASGFGFSFVAPSWWSRKPFWISIYKDGFPESLSLISVVGYKSSQVTFQWSWRRHFCFTHLSTRAHMPTEFRTPSQLHLLSEPFWQLTETVALHQLMWTSARYASNVMDDETKLTEQQHKPPEERDCTSLRAEVCECNAEQDLQTPAWFHWRDAVSFCLLKDI